MKLNRLASKYHCLGIDVPQGLDDECPSLLVREAKRMEIRLSIEIILISLAGTSQFVVPSLRIELATKNRQECCRCFQWSEFERKVYAHRPGKDYHQWSDEYRYLYARTDCNG